MHLLLLQELGGVGLELPVVGGEEAVVGVTLPPVLDGVVVVDHNALINNGNGNVEAGQAAPQVVSCMLCVGQTVACTLTEYQTAKAFHTDCLALAVSQSTSPQRDTAAVQIS